jgi:hypothetical protein
VVHFLAHTQNSWRSLQHLYTNAQLQAAPSAARMASSRLRLRWTRFRSLLPLAPLSSLVCPAGR